VLQDAQLARPSGEEVMATEIWLDIHFVKDQFSKFRACRACGAPLHFRRGEKGSWVPLDLSTARKNPDTKKWEAQSHYQTCTDPKQFSKNGKRAKLKPAKA
jgi:hypothetical protein